MNQDTAQRPEILRKVRASTSKITTLNGQTGPTGGPFYMHPILLEIGINGYRCMTSCEIVKAGK